MNYADHINEKKTPQTEPIPHSAQVKNSAGGYSFAVDDWTRLDRFLVLGSEGGSYYASERKLTLENADVIKRCIALDGLRTVNRIVQISQAGRAPKNDPAILALALCAKKGDELTRKAAYRAVPEVCRIGTHLMHFAEYIQALGGWGRGARRAIADWYNKKPAKDLVYQAVKYQARDGWSNRDLLRLSHPKAPTKEHAAIYNWITDGHGTGDTWEKGSAIEMLWAFERLKTVKSVDDVVRAITDYRLPREAVPTEWLNHEIVWEALLEHMKPEAMVRNLAKMTAVGLIKPLSEGAMRVCAKLVDTESLVKARLHPIKVLAALLTYQQGHGVKGSLTWEPVQQIVDALDAAFYSTFAAVEPTNKRHLLALDVSGSMTWASIAGVPGLTPRVGSAAMSMVTAAVEKQHHLTAFASGITPFRMSPNARLDTVCQHLDRLPATGTDCSLPMLYAMERQLDVDVFVVYTDSETWAGRIHPVQALEQYRQARGIGAKLIVVGMLSNGFTIADPNDAGMLDVVGFDTAAPALMADFARE